MGCMMHVLNLRLRGESITGKGHFGPKRNACHGELAGLIGSHDTDRGICIAVNAEAPLGRNGKEPKHVAA